MAVSLCRAKAAVHVSRASTWGFLTFIIANCICACDGHGRLIEPPSRASAWRYGFQTPPDYNDHELYCGGFTRQWKRNGGKCGECGDAWDLAEPRPHEQGGQWGQGVIVRKYVPGSEMTIRVELTASHMGYFEFRLCEEPKAKQSCLDKHLLRILSGSPAQPTPNDLNTRFYPRNGSRIYDIKAQLPELKCDQCVLQWRYIAGNNWGMCDDGNGAVGCGPQEEFRACSDIALGKGAYIPMRPIRPTLRTTQRPQPTSTDTTQQESASEGFNYLPISILAIIVLLVLCAFAVWYMYRNHGPKIKIWMETAGNRFCKSFRKDGIKPTTKTPASVNNVAHSIITNQTKGFENQILAAPPVPPPRSKRQARVKEMSPDESSIA